MLNFSRPLALGLIAFAAVHSIAAPPTSPAGALTTENDIRREAEKQQQGEKPHTPLNIIMNVQQVCAGQIVAGWIQTNDNWDPTTCGKPTSITYNVWTIRRYDILPVGSEMVVCAGSVPTGWVKVGEHWDPTSCGHPTSIFGNMMTIKRLS